MEDFHRQKEGGIKKLLEKERIVSGLVSFFGGEGKTRVLLCRLPH